MLKLKLLILLVLLSVCLQAQLSLGVKGGINRASVDFNPRMSQDVVTVYHGGTMIRYISEPHFGIQAELNYTQKGWKQIFKDKTDYYQRVIDYIELPVLTHIYFGNGNLRVILNLGFAFSHANKASVDALVNEVLVSKDYEFKDGVDKNFEYGILGGGGFEYKYKMHSVFLETRFYYGLTDLRKLEDAAVIDFARNKYLSVSFGYFFTFNRSKK